MTIYTHTSMLFISTLLVLGSFNTLSADDNTSPYGYMMGPGNMMGSGHMMGPGYMGYRQMGPGYMGMNSMHMGYGRMGFGNMMGMGMMGPGFMHMLNLSDSQRASMREIHQSMRGQMFALHDKQSEYASELYNLYNEEKPSAKKIGAVYKKIFDIKRQQIELKVTTHNKIYDVLSKEQKNQLKQWRTPSMRNRGMPGPGGMPHMMQ